MSTDPNAVLPQPSARGRRISGFLLTNPITRLIVGFLVIGVSATRFQNLLQPLRLTNDQPLTFQPLALHWLSSILFCCATVTAYALFVRMFEKRWPDEVSLKGLWFWLPIGFVIGGALSGSAVRAIYSTAPVGPAYLSGGSFGIEGSLISTVLCAILGFGFCIASFRSQRVIGGFWTRR